ncbi:RNase H family protein [Clostridium tertium]|uniref:RNase H family protein n=1 Tax=Clostridium tertium TaxID=1559 RepID=UPI0023B335AA|nr:RNase H family protein [Clostridium tertium]
MSDTIRRLTVYISGSCIGNGNERNKGGIGVLYLFKNWGNDTALKIQGGLRNTTNNVMELEACIQALKCIPPTDRANIVMEIYTDSAYILNCMKFSWYNKWRKNNWRTSKRQTVANKEMWIELLDLIDQYVAINFYYTPTNGVKKFSVVVSELAKEGANKLNGGIVKMQCKISEL